MELNILHMVTVTAMHGRQDTDVPAHEIFFIGLKTIIGSGKGRLGG